MKSRFTLFSLGWLAGTAWQLQERELMAVVSYGLATGLGLCLLFIPWALHGVKSTWVTKCVTGLFFAGACLCSLGQAGWRAHAHLSHRIDPNLEASTVSVEGVIAAMPQRAGDGWRFRLEVDHAPMGIPSHLLLSWYGNRPSGVVDVTQLPEELRAGDRWRFTVRLKAPHGHINPHGFDYELWLWEQNLHATGYVRTGATDPRPLKLGASHAHPVERWRQDAREAIERRISDRSMSGIIAALLVGDQASIERADWEVFRATGVAHLMAISGLHITGLAWFAAALTSWVWRRSGVWSKDRPWCLRWPAPYAAQVAGCAVALVYAVFTGWGLPAQRTVWMLCVASGLRWHGARWPWPQVWLLVCTVVVALDPWAMLQAGFWLSFVAVAVLFASGTASEKNAHSLRQRAWQLGRNMVREQWLMSVCLAPLSLLLFHQVSLVGLLANLVAVPWVTLWITPLCLLGLLWPMLWSWAQVSLEVLRVCLMWVSQGSWTQWSSAAAPAWVGGAALLGVALWTRRLPAWMRVSGLVLVLPLLTWQAPRPRHGAFELIAADMGQGHAVLVRTATHALLYDTGPRYSAETDAGQRVLVPLLRSLGERLDGLIISHQDSDHSGGAAAVLAMQPQARIWSSIPQTHSLQNLGAMQRCESGQRWVWDGVVFSVLHPQKSDYERGLKPNAMSCVLRLESADGIYALLVGDIEAAQEQYLLHAEPSRLRADWLLVPHHGSGTSSTRVFLQAVQPRVAVVQAGYRNRFGHPRQEVMARYAEQGVLVVQSPRCGASRWESTDPTLVHCARQELQRYWHHRMP